MLTRIVILWTLLLALIGCAAQRAAAAGELPGSACGNGSVSALNQYCEQIPSATGGQIVRPGTLALGDSLPSLAAHGSARSGISAASRRGLRALPAAFHSRRIAGSVTEEGIVSQSLTLILILIALALGLAALAHERRRRRRRVS